MCLFNCYQAGLFPLRCLISSFPKPDNPHFNGLQRNIDFSVCHPGGRLASGISQHKPPIYGDLSMVCYWEIVCHGHADMHMVGITVINTPVRWRWSSQMIIYFSLVVFLDLLNKELFGGNQIFILYSTDQRVSRYEQYNQLLFDTRLSIYIYVSTGFHAILERKLKIIKRRDSGANDEVEGISL